MSDAPDMRPMDWVEVAARAHEEGRRKGLEQAAQELEKAGSAADDDDAISFVGPFCRSLALVMRAMKDKQP